MGLVRVVLWNEEVEMAQDRLFELTVDTIMRRWPATIPIFIRQGMHCVGCPVGGLHTLDDAAHAHRIEPDVLLASIKTEIGRR